MLMPRGAAPITEENVNASPMHIREHTILEKRDRDCIQENAYIITYIYICMLGLSL